MSKEHEIRDMAKLSILDNKLNDIQLKNLKMFPLVFFNGVTEAKVTYDLHTEKPSVEYEIENKTDPDKLSIKYEFDRPKTNSSVEYNLVIDELSPNDNLSYRFESLERAVRNIFWKEVRVTVLFNDKKVFESTYV